MKAAYLTTPAQMTLLEHSKDALAEKILETRACGICHSDRKAFLHPPNGMELPRILGHEVAGILQKDLPHLELSKGDRVVLWPALACNACRFCRSNRPNLCPELELFGYSIDGGFSNALFLTPEIADKTKAFKIPDSISFDQATLTEPLACILNGLNKVRRLHETSLIIGAGLMGRLAARVIKAITGAAALIHDTDPIRTKNAAQEGDLFSNGQSADTILIAASTESALQLALTSLTPGGTVVLFSGMPKGARIDTLHNELHQKEQSLAGAYGCTPADMDQAMKLLESGKVQVPDLITRRIPLAELSDELSRTPGPDEYKTIVY